MTQKMKEMGVTNHHDQRIVPSLQKTLEKNPDYKIYLEKIESEE